MTVVLDPISTPAFGSCDCNHEINVDVFVYVLAGARSARG